MRDLGKSFQVSGGQVRGRNSKNYLIMLLFWVCLAGTVVADPNLVGWWKFDEGQGDIAYDSAGNNDGTIYGAQWTSGKIGDWALDFDGDDDSVELPLNNPVWLPTGDFSFSMWVHPISGTGNTEVFFDADAGWSGE